MTDHQDCLAYQERWEPAVFQDHGVSQVCLAHQGFLVRRVVQALKEMKDPSEHLAHQDFLETRDPLDHRAQLVRWDPQDKRDLVESRAYQVFQAQTERREIREFLEKLAKKETKVLRVIRDP
jgi:hypothetical protein